jgi:hypothetical protein
MYKRSPIFLLFHVSLLQKLQKLQKYHHYRRTGSKAARVPRCEHTMKNVKHPKNLKNKDTSAVDTDRPRRRRTLHPQFFPKKIKIRATL